MNRSILGLAMAMIIVQPAKLSAQSEALEAAKQTGPWRLDAGEQKCRLAAVYGDAPDGHVLFIEQDQPGSAVGFAIGSRSLRSLDWGDTVALKFGTLPAFEINRYARGKVGDYRPAILIASRSLDADLPNSQSDDAKVQGLDRIPVERFEGMDELQVIQDGETHLALALPKLSNALEALNRCAEGFITFWGLDLEKHRTMTRKVKFTNLERVARDLQSKYPSRAIRSGEQGVVRFLVIVDKEGRVTDCRQSDVTALQDLDSPACKAMHKARFEPALDESGNAMKSYYASQIRYVLP